MREIKFRVRNLEDNKFENLSEVIIAIDGAGIDIYRNNGYILYGYELNQYTGLKDINDKEIYEGDIVKYKRINGSFEYGKVLYNGCAFDIDNGWNLQVFVARGLEVVGNIYEDYNLLQ